jgi:hypothetical protein
MRRDVLRRVRWANVALAAAVIAALVIVVVWPLVADSTPALPPDTARPLVVPDTPTGAKASPATKRRAARTKDGAAGRPGAKKRPREGAAPRTALPRRATKRPHTAAADPATKRSGRAQSPRTSPTPGGAIAPPARTGGPGTSRRVGPEAGGEFGFEGGR